MSETAYPKIILEPEQIPGSGSCVMLKAADSLYIQSFDAYGYQRELSIRPEGDGYELHCYMHPARREKVQLSKLVGEKMIAAIVHQTQQYPSLLFNAQGAPERGSVGAKNHGFVQMQERIFRGVVSKSILSDLDLNAPMNVSPLPAGTRAGQPAKAR